MIPATPEKTEKPTIPVRYIGVSGDTLGKGRVFWATYAYEDLAALKCHDKNENSKHDCMVSYFRVPLNSLNSIVLSF